MDHTNPKYGIVTPNPHRERDEAAEAWHSRQEQHSCNGISLLPRDRRCFSAGASWTLASDPCVLALVDKVQAFLNQFALEKKEVEARNGRHVQLDYGLMIELNDALAAYRERTTPERTGE